jgi:recombination protein RecT
MTTQTVGNAVANRESGPTTLIWSKKKHFDMVLPASVDVEAFLGCAAGALYASNDLMKAATSNPDSLVTVLMRCASLGHLPGTDEFYLYNRKRKGREEVSGTEGYRGIIERMYRSGAVSKVIVREVCAKDYFRYTEGEDERPVHRFTARQGTTGADFFGDNGSTDRGEMVGVYAVAQLTTGAWSRPAILTRDDVMAARDASDSRNSEYSPWNRLDGGKNHPEFQGRSMWWKTAARRLEPWVPTSREYRREMLAASAKAAELAGPRQVPALSRPSDEIVDAELVDEQPAVEAPAAPAPAPRGPRSRRNATTGPSPAQAATPPAAPVGPVPDAGEAPVGGEPAPRLASDGQVGMIQQHFQRFGYGTSPDDKAARLRITARLAGYDGELASTKQLDPDQAASVIRQIQALPDVAALQALVEDGEVPGE